MKAFPRLRRLGAPLASSIATAAVFTRSFGNGSVSEEAIRECDTRGIECIVGGCPLMFCEPVESDTDACGGGCNGRAAFPSSGCRFGHSPRGRSNSHDVSELW
jgi:hypothetical protein